MYDHKHMVSLKVDISYQNILHPIKISVYSNQTNPENLKKIFAL